MKFIFLLLLLLLLGAVSGKCQKSHEVYLQLSIDELVAKADSLENKQVEVIGLVAHICGVDGHKMKLKSPNGSIFKIVPYNPDESFDSALKNQLVCVRGVVEIRRIEKAYVDRMEKEGTLLCHIDHTLHVKISLG